MVTKVRTIDFLPEIFKTKTNEQFLAATLDQITQQPDFRRIQGYIGSKFGYGIGVNDKYLVEPNKIRTDYQLEPSVVFKKKDTKVAVDLITYPGILDSLKLQGSITDNNTSLFSNQFYSWDSFVDLDKVINFSQYYWLPIGPDSVVITNTTLFKNLDYTVSNELTGFKFSTSFDTIPETNPILTLVRGGTYTFAIDQTSNFWIQTEPGISGTMTAKPNISTRDVYGVENNGQSFGTVTFTVPDANAQNDYVIPGDFPIDIATERSWDDINGKLVSNVGSIDDVFNLKDKTLIFYGTNPGVNGYVSQFFDGAYDNSSSFVTPINITVTNVNGYTGVIICSSTTNLVVNQAIYFSGVTFGGITSNQTYYINYIYSSTEFSVSEEPGGVEYTSANIASGSMTGTVNQGLFEVSKATEINKHYYKINFIPTSNGDNVISLSEVGLLPDNTKLSIRYGSEYISRNFVKNSLGAIELIPHLTAAMDTLYYQDSVNPEKLGVIKLVDNVDNGLINVNTIIGKKTYTSPNNVKFTNGLKVQFLGNIYPVEYGATQYYVEGVGTSIQLLPITDFEIPETYSQILTTPYDDTEYDSYKYEETLSYPADQDYLTISRLSRDKNGWSRSNRWFHIDVLNTTIAASNSSPIALEALGNPNSRAKRPILEFYPNLKLFNAGNTSKTNTDFINFTATDAFTQVAGQTSFSPDGGSSYLFDGCTIIFAGDTDVQVRNKIWLVNFEEKSESTDPVINLTVIPDGDITYNDQTVIVLGETYAGKTYWFDAINWIEAQTKTRLNQPPTFDIFDNNGVSFSDNDFYPSNDFTGCTLIEYAIGSGTDDPILGFPIKYSSLNNLGDITFNVTLNSQTFNYLSDSVSASKSVSDGYVYNYTTQTEYDRAIGWQTAPAESFQYQIFEYTYTGTPIEPVFKCDVPVKDQTTTPWPVSVVYVNNARLANTDYTVTLTSYGTEILLLTTPVTGSKIVVMLFSDQPSKVAYYQIPTNLDHNPFNGEITSINLGDVRGHYKSICNNAPNFVGLAFGANNYRDLGNVVPYGNKIIQNSASMVNSAAFLRNNSNNFFDALSYNANEYQKFKALLLNTLTNNDYNSLDSSAYILDDVLDRIGSTRIDINPFFWSDMIPSKNAFITNSYLFKTEIKASIYKLSRVYDFTQANYYGILVYLARRENGAIVTTLLIRDVDYIVSATEKSLTITKTLVNNDAITIKEYNQTYGSFVPNTPTKLGLYPAFVPEVLYDATYVTPTYFIRGHDGAYTKLYGTYENGLLNDYRDRVLLEYETRIYNNLKISSKIPIGYDEVVPGQFRDIGINFQQYNQVYSTQFLNWIGLNRIDYAKHIYNSTNPFTYNYKKSTFNFNNTTVEQGNWRGIYLWLYDTSNPDTMPWEMLGLPSKPLWWESRYGVTPYTSDNTYMWQDIANGYVWNNGDPYTAINRVRPQLLDILPVDSTGKLRDPLEFLLSSYDSSKFSENWTFGDVGPVEYSYLKSSTWPFDLMRLIALFKPAKFFSLCVDVDKYNFNTEFNQFLYNNRYRDSITSLDVYGDGVAVHSYINWMVDYLYQFGINGSTTIKTLIQNLDVRLSYRLAGFTDKDLVNFYVEKGSPSSKNNSLLIPDDSYSILLYDNQPTDTIVYSSIIIQKTDNGYKVYGNSQNKLYFTTQIPINNGGYDTITVNNVSAKVPKAYYTKTVVIPYGEEFLTINALMTFIKGHGLYLTSLGMQFDDIENGLELSWNQMIAEVLYWVQTGWESGSIINVNPCSRIVHINKENSIVQPLTIQQENFILNQNSVPIALSDLSITRLETEFKIKTLNQGDSMSFFRANLSTIEHVVIFDNDTVFNDVLCNLITGLRQQRIFVRGTKTAEWNGLVNAAGFILNQNNIIEWQKNAKYNKGTIVLYKNTYYMANKTVVLPSTTFNYNDWLETSYDMVQKGLLPNPSTRAYEATLFYDTTNPNLENDADLLAFSLIGYRPRNYLANANLDDGTQVNLYKNMISTKGTVDSVTRLQGINLQQNALNYDIHENWAIKSTEFGGLLNQNFVEVTLDESILTGNPSILSITDGNSVDGSQQDIPLYKIKNYGRPISSSNILPTTTQYYQDKLPSAGYVNIDDVLELGYTLNDLADDGIANLYKNDYIWVANKDNTWQIYTPVSTKALVISAGNNLNGTVTITFNKPHGLIYNQAMGIINFDTRVNGYYLVESVPSLTTITITLTLDPTVTTINGSGLSYLLQSQRVVTARDIDGLPLLNAEYAQNKVWVDKNQSGDWTVYEKTNNYTYSEIPKIALDTTTFGSSVAYIPDVGYFIGDPGDGKLYHYDISPNGAFYVRNSISYPGSEYGTTIVRSNDILVVSRPDALFSQIYIYRIPQTTNINSIILQQVVSIVGGRVGESMAISGDSNLLYLGARDDNAVVVFQRSKEYTYTSAGISLSTATVVGTTYFKCSGDVLSYILEGQQINYIVNYASLGVTTQATVSGGAYSFRVSGDQRALLAAGDKVSFYNTGAASTDLYTIATESYDPGTNRTTFYLVEMVRVGVTIPVGTTIYKVTFSDDSLHTVVTGIYDSVEDETTFYTNEKVKYTTASGSYIYLASVDYQLVGIIENAFSEAGDKFGYSLATNYDGSKLSVGAPYKDYSPTLLNTGTVYVYDRLVENFEIQYDQSPYQPLLILLAFTPDNPNTFASQTRIYVNGELLDTSKYVILLNIVIIGTIGLYAGDIVTISTVNFVLIQQLNSYDSVDELRQGELFGYSMGYNTNGGELVVGAPYDITSQMQEGALHRFTSPGKRFGVVTGLIAANLTSATYLLINGYRVSLPVGNAAVLANAINAAGVTNIFSYATEDGRLVIRLRDNNLGAINNKLNVSVFNSTYLYELGFVDYIKSQVIQDPHAQTNTQFGAAIAFNEDNSFVASAPASIRYLGTTFDFSDDNNIHNDTAFDNNFTTFEEKLINGGSVYMFDYVYSYEESLTNIGKYLYAQSCNDLELDYGAQPLYGTAVSFYNNVVMIGTPNFKPATEAGRVVVYTNDSTEVNWHVYRESSDIVDIEKIQKVQLYDNITDANLVSLDYIDPLQGKLLGVVRENLDFIGMSDPAGYNSPNMNTGRIVWAKAYIGKLWFDTSSTRFLNYHQNDVVYNSQYWGKVFPGSDVTVYSWIESDVVPSFYVGTGTPYDLMKYSVTLITDSNNNLIARYYYWVRNTNTLFTDYGKTLSDTILAQYIADPINSGVSFFAPLQSDAYALYNAGDYINDTSTNLHLGFGRGTMDTTGHNEFQLIRSEYPDDFLPGFVNREKGYNTPVGLYDRYLDSFTGTDETGALVPDPYLPKLLQTGVSVRPRQSFFINRLDALKNYLEYANGVIKLYPINEFGNTTLLVGQGTYFDVSNYWENIYWWADGYSDSTRAAIDVPIYSDLLTLTVTDGYIAGVTSNAQGNREVYIYSAGVWTRIGVQNGTIQFLSTLWDYQSNKIGFGDNFFDSTPYDYYPSVETRYIIRALNEQIYVGPLYEYRNKSLTLMFEYIASENVESQNYLPWLNKTSFTDVSYTVRELTTNQKFQRDNEGLLEGYINEVKPYRVVLKDFYLKYSHTDIFAGFISDFDLPGFYDENIGKFVSPQLVNTQYNGDPYQFSKSSPGWEGEEYTSWFNNYGTMIGDINNTTISVVSLFISTLDQEIYVDNLEGFPVAGRIIIDSEIITYTSIDRLNNKLYGISRGVDNTTPTAHYAGTSIVIDMPGIVVLDGSFGYTSTPLVTAYVDTSIYPAPRRPAVLRAVLSGDKVIGVDVIDAGEGYVVNPEIVFDPSFTLSTELFRINFVNNSIQILSVGLATGNLIYSQGISSNGITIIPDGYYYVSVQEIVALFAVEIEPYGNAVLVQFHKTYRDAINLKNATIFINETLIPSDYVHEVSGRAKAIPTMISPMVRSIKTTLRYDRTSYQAKVKPWTPDTYYASTYISIGNDSSSPAKLYISAEYEDLSGTVTPAGGTGATFNVYNVLLGESYVVNIVTMGINYDIGDTIVIPGTQLNGSTPENDCTIEVVDNEFAGGITEISVTGTAADPSLASLQGATLPITGKTASDVGGAVVSVDYSYSGLKPGQANNSYMYFYRILPKYTYDDSGSGGAIIDIYHPQFNPDTLANQYYMLIRDFGTIYNDGDIINIAGSLLGGVNDINDARIYIQFARVDGSIFSANIQGISVGQFAQYYVKAISNTALEIYSDSDLNVPVPYGSFIWDGSLDTDYGYLPEPVIANYAYNYEPSSIVSYAGFIWQCIDSNNDATFNPSKWAILSQADTTLNALDRIEGYYEPTINMPGKDAQQLVKGITYPNNVYYGNAFAPEDELPLDFEVRDQPFYPADINVKAIVSNGTTLFAACDASEYSSVLVSNETGTWDNYIISEVPLGITDIIYGEVNDEYMFIITTTSTASPILISYEGTNWISVGEFTPYDTLGFGVGGFDSTSISFPSVPMYGAIISNGIPLTVGKEIVRSIANGLDWTRLYSIGSRLENSFRDIIYITIPGYIGYIAVGGAEAVVSGSGTPVPVVSNVSLIYTNPNIDGNWHKLTPTLTYNGLRSVAASEEVVVVVGESCEVWYSTNASNWVESTISWIGSSLSITINSVIYGDGLFIAVGDKIDTGDSDPGFIMTSTDGISWTEISSQYITTDNLNKVYFDDGYYYIVGENHTIVRSNDGSTWTSVSNIQVDDPYYVVTGNDFLYGYGPEELVAGVVSDTISMHTSTAPGAPWDLDDAVGYWYKHTGFNMKTKIATLDYNLTISFANVVVNPARLSVFIINDATHQSYRIYENITSTSNSYSYTIDWFSQIITLNTAIPAGSSILIEVYEVGNGRELFRSNSKIYPLTEDDETGYSKFVLPIQFEPIVNDPIVYVNGVKLTYETDYTITSGNTSEMIMLFYYPYSSANDYVVFAILGTTITGINSVEYGYSIPETQVYNPPSSTTSIPLDLSLVTVTGNNVENAVVELNGRRLVPYPLSGYDYTFNLGTDTLNLLVAIDSDDLLAITTYYDTVRQYMVTDKYLGITNTEISYIDHSLTPIQITFASDPGFSSADLIKIDGVIGTVELNNNTYYVKPLSTYVSGITYYPFELYTNIGLTNPVTGPDMSMYIDSGYAWLNYSTPLVPYPDLQPGWIMPDMTYTDATRTWVTVNGYRVDPTQLRFDETNLLSILSPITQYDEVIVTAMVTGASPNQAGFTLSVNKKSEPTIYRTNFEDGSWLVQDFLISDDTMYFYNVSNFTETIQVTSTVIDDSGTLVAYVQCDTNEVKEAVVYNNNTITTLSTDSYNLGLYNGRSAIVITDQASVGDSLTVTLTIGNVIEIGAERIRFNVLNTTNNTVSGLTRGINGTVVIQTHNKYEIGYGINVARKLTEEEYNSTWNSENITPSGDPLQISTTQTAIFLQSNEINQ